MQEKEILKQLNNLNLIRPSNAFATRSKQIIFAMPQERAQYSGFFFKPAFVGLFSILLIAISAGFYYIGSRNLQTAAYSSLSQDKLSAELKNLTIAIEVDNLEYRQSVNKTVAYALQEIDNNGTSHLNKELLKTEQDNLNITETSNEDINTLLNTVIN